MVRLNTSMLALFLGCIGMASAETDNILRVAVLASGEIQLNGAPATLGEVAEQFAVLSKSGGTVWYYREAAGTEPPAEAMSVMELVVTNRLPVSMSTKPDFSDYVDQHGNSRPR